ncbi:MAG: RluA family pseudouridine synthase [Fusobacteriaceae bacterium]
MEFKIDEKFADVRVDRFLRKMLPDIPLTEIFKGIRTGNIKVNGKKTKENARLALDDTIKIFWLAGEKMDAVAPKKENFIELSSHEIEDIKKSTVFENDEILIINKRENLVMHVGSGHDYGLTEMVQSYLKNSDFSFINRIDKATSGMVIGVKTLPMARILAEEIRENRVDKRYYILVEGRVTKDDFTKTTYLKKIEDRVIELDRFEVGAKESTSHFKVLKRDGGFTLLEGELASGRTHQLRVQLSAMGHPIVGDTKYGSKVRSKRMMLHSYYLEIPKIGIKLTLPLPESFILKKK